MMDPLELVLRLGASLVAGAILGLERESRGRAAGLRTTILVSSASTLAMILSDTFYDETHALANNAAGWRPDPARLGAGILTGIGFLGAGVILQQGNAVRGVTTASLIWFVTVMGLCFGSGQFLLGGLALAVGCLALFVLTGLENRIQSEWNASITVMSSESGTSVPELVRIIEDRALHVKSVNIARDVSTRTRTASFQLRFKRTNLVDLPNDTINSLCAQPGVLTAEWKA